MKSKLSLIDKRAAHLYKPGLVRGYDYVVCPVTSNRKSMIKSSYIINVLKMSVKEFDRLYPATQKICTKRKENIKLGLNQIDKETGLTKHALSTVKAKVTLSTMDKDGISGYARKGKKTRATHMGNIDEFGRNGYRRQADARLTTVLPNGLTIEQQAHQKQKETLFANYITGSGGASKVSKKVLASIIQFLESKKLKYYFDRKEYGIKDPETGNHYFYDLTIPDLKIAIEYQSSAWHSNPGWEIARWDNWAPPKGKSKTATESLDYDYNKARSLFKHRGIVTHYIWEDTVTDDIERILCLLRT